MTEKRLEQYRALKMEIAQLESRIASMVANGPQITSDSVSTAADFPYSKHTVIISGIEDVTAYEGRLSRLRKRLEQSRAELDELDDFINSVSDPSVRTILRYKYVDGWGWLRIARKIGAYNECVPRIKVKRFFNKYEMYEMYGI